MPEKMMCPFLAIMRMEYINLFAEKPGVSEKQMLENVEAAAACKKSKCEWYTSVYTTEGHQEHGCAIRFMAMMNADGRMVV